MKRTGFLIVMLIAAMMAYCADYVPKDMVWTSQSRNSSESMPCGGHDIGMNVWVEGGDLLFYVQQSGWFDENNTLLKAGRWRLHIDGQPFDGEDFEQRLCLDEGCIYIRGGGVEVRLWVDVEEPVMFVATESQHTERAVLSYESWRYRDRAVTKAECQQCSYKWLVPKDCTTFADSIVPVHSSQRTENSSQRTENREQSTENREKRKEKRSQSSIGALRFWHQNRAETVFDFTVAYEHLDAIKDSLYNPIGGLLMKGEMWAPGFSYAGTTTGEYAGTDYKAWNFVNEKLRKATITIQLETRPQPLPTGSGVVTTSDSNTLYSPPSKGGAGGESSSRKRSARWWHDYWQRSWIVSDTPNDSLQAMIRNYELMRYMLGCNAKGAWPTKFNGGLFTFDPFYVSSDPQPSDSGGFGTPDYRKWGGGTMTAQNQRLVYWPLLKSGDYDVLRPQIATYLRMLSNAIARTRYYWGHGGASFTEQIENFGLPNPAEYGKHKEGYDYGMERNAWLEYEWDTALEFALMELLRSVECRVESVEFATAIPSPKGTAATNPTPCTLNSTLASEVLRFFDEHYQWQAKRLGSKALDENGHLIIYPGSGCETYKMAYNPSSTIAGLQAVSEKVRKFATAIPSPDDTAAANSTPYALNPNLLPDIPLRVIDGDTCIAPAVVWARIQNTETPQLYPVWPWRIYGIGRPGLDIARNTYWKDPHAIAMRSSKGWKQDNIWAACLGLTDEARRLNTEKLADGPYRFTAFYDPGFDWAPDHNRGGAGMIGLQEMLLQETPDGEPILFPAWPREWNCRFRLYTLSGQIVEATLENGELRRQK
jgi:hypothetical protein